MRQKFDMNEAMAIVVVLTAAIGFCVGSIYAFGEVLHFPPKVAVPIGFVVGLSLTCFFFWFVLGVINEFIEASTREAEQTGVADSSLLRNNDCIANDNRLRS